jgi:hypothetical protein
MDQGASHQQQHKQGHRPKHMRPVLAEQKVRGDRAQQYQAD